MINYKNIIKIFDSDLSEATWKTVKGQHVAFNKNGEIVAGNPKVIGKGGNKSTTEKYKNKSINIKKKFNGSESQVKLANDIIEDLNKSLNEMNNYYNDDKERKEGVNDLADGFSKAINKIDNASDIIDMREIFKPSNLSDLVDKIIMQRKK